MGGADIGTGSASDAQPFGGNHVTVFPPFFHFESTRSHHLFAYPAAQSATRTSIGYGAGRDIEITRNLQQDLSPRGPGQQPLKSLRSGLFHEFAFCINFKTVSNLEYTRKQDPGLARPALDLNGAKLAGADGSKRFMIADRGHPDALGPQDLQDGDSLHRLTGLSINMDFHVFQWNPCSSSTDLHLKEAISFKIKKGENFNHMNTLKYFEDQNLSLTQLVVP